MTTNSELIWGASFFSGSLAQLIARLSGLPSVVLLLALGLLVGQAGLLLVQPEALGQGLEPLVGLLVSLVLFDGGLKLRLAGRELQRTVIQLVLVRGVLGLVGGAALAHLFAGLAWPLAWVFGAIALATGPTVISPMVRQMRLVPGLAQVLEAEGLILEPAAAVLALLLLQLALGDVPAWQEVAGLLLLRLGGGALLGAVAGGLLGLLLERLPADADGLRLQLSLGFLFLLVAGTQTLLPEAGFPAAVMAGVVVGVRLDQQATQLDELIFQLAQLAITVLFPLLAADLSWGELSPLGWGGVVCVFALMLFRWPVVQVAGLGIASLAWRDKLLLSWVAPRGIVTAAVASLFALQLDAAGVVGGGSLKGLVFLTILITVSVQGFTAPWLAQQLGLVASEAALDPAAGFHQHAFLHAGGGNGLAQQRLRGIGRQWAFRQPLEQCRQGWACSIAAQLLLGRFAQLGSLEERAGLLDAVLEGHQRWADQGGELLQPGVIGLVTVPTLGAPEGQQVRQQLLGAALVQHLAVQPVELVPVEAGAGFVHPIEGEHASCIGEAEALAHALRRRPAQQCHVVGQGIGGVALVAEVAHRGDAIAFRELLALLVEDQGRVGKHRRWGTEGFVEQQLLGGVGDVVFAADHMGDRHGSVVYHHHQVVEGITDLIGRCPAGDHHVATEIGAAPA
ncbi:MAG: hypothetical protein RLZZ11_1683, partial [Cyanobacteriota bacterium]